jgi:hypothetical protein
MSWIGSRIRVVRAGIRRWRPKVSRRWGMMLLVAIVAAPVVWLVVDLLLRSDPKLPIPIPGPRWGWEQDLIAKGRKIEEGRLTDLLQGRSKVEETFDRLLTPTTQIFWASSDSKAQIIAVGAGQQNLAEIQLALIQGYGKRLHMPNMHVRAIGSPVHQPDKSLDKLILKLIPQ